MLCVSSSPSISIIKPIINIVRVNILASKQNDSNLVAKIKTSIQKDFDERILNYKDIKELLTLAALIDPRTKDLMQTVKQAYVKGLKKVHKRKPEGMTYGCMCCVTENFAGGWPAITWGLDKIVSSRILF